VTVVHVPGSVTRIWFQKIVLCIPQCWPNAEATTLGSLRLARKEVLPAACGQLDKAALPQCSAQWSPFLDVFVRELVHPDDAWRPVKGPPPFCLRHLNLSIIGSLLPWSHFLLELGFPARAIRPHSIRNSWLE
jgi:hypothetical protein